LIVAGDIAEYNASEVELKLASLLASISASHVNASAPQLLGIFPFVRYQVDVTITAQDDLFSSMAQHLLSAAHISSLSAALRLNITDIVGTTAARLAFAAPSPPPPVPPPSPLPSFPNPLPPPTPNPPLLPGGALKPTVTITISVDTTLADFDAATQSTFKIGLAAQFDDVDEDDVQLTISARRMLSSEALNLVERMLAVEHDPAKVLALLSDRRRRLSTISVTSRIIFPDSVGAQSAATSIQDPAFVTTLASATFSSLSGITAPLVESSVFGAPPPPPITCGPGTFQGLGDVCTPCGEQTHHHVVDARAARSKFLLS
jgi:hypothetical protein